MITDARHTMSRTFAYLAGATACRLAMALCICLIYFFAAGPSLNKSQQSTKLTAIAMTFGWCRGKGGGRGTSTNPRGPGQLTRATATLTIAQTFFIDSFSLSEIACPYTCSIEASRDDLSSACVQLPQL